MDLKGGYMDEDFMVG